MPSRFDPQPVDLDDPDGWRAANEWAIPPAPRQRRAIDSGQQRQAYRVLRSNFRKRAMAAREPCWLCGNAIDYNARGTPKAWECDHFVPVSVDESLALEPSNFRSSHSLCNRRRQAGSAAGVVIETQGSPQREPGYDPQCDIGIPSEVW